MCPRLIRLRWPVVRIAGPIIVAASLCASAALAAESASTRDEAAPAVSGEDLEGMNQAAQPADDAGADRASQPDRSESASRAGTATRGDRLDLDTTVVTGNRELPKVLYIVPWKKAELGELPAQPFNTLLDEVLTPVDRDVFRREVTYYDAVSHAADATQSTVDESR